MNKSINKFPAVLVLADGTVFKGTSIGKIGTTTGEICFNTGMTGYQEVFTDPSYFGQILLQTNVHIGNYGIHAEEVESDDIKIAGLVCKQFNVPYSRKMAGMSVQESAAVVGLLQSLKGRYTILLVEHDMNAVFALADRISVLVYGQLLMTGTPDEIRNNEEVRAVYLGDEEIST